MPFSICFYFPDWSANPLHFENFISFSCSAPFPSPTMSSFSEMTDEEPLSASHGRDVVPPDVVQTLQNEAANVKSWRMQFFNSRQGWMLRRVVRGHRTCRGSNQYCALCAQNVDGAMRTKTRAHCVLCQVPLCAIPREGETGDSCFHVWHNTDKLKRRVYKSKCGPSTEEERADDEPQMTPEPESTANTPPPPETRNRGQPSNGVRYFRARREAEERAEEEKRNAQPVVDEAIRRWAVHGETYTCAKRLLQNLHLVLPQNFEWSVNHEQLGKGEEYVRKEIRRALLLLHPDRLARARVSQTELAIATRATSILVENMQRSRKRNRQN